MEGNLADRNRASAVGCPRRGPLYLADGNNLPGGGNCMSSSNSLAIRVLELCDEARKSMVVTRKDATVVFHLTMSTFAGEEHEPY